MKVMRIKRIRGSTYTVKLLLLLPTRSKAVVRNFGRRRRSSSSHVAAFASIRLIVTNSVVFAALVAMAAPRLRRRLSQLCSGSASFPNRRSPRLDPPLSSAVVLLTVPAEPPLRPACIAVMLDGSPPPKAICTEAG